MPNSPVSSRSAQSLPPTVNLHLVAHCNMKCRYCYAPFLAERRVASPSVEQLTDVLGQLAAHGVRRVTFAGGEPTLHRELATLLHAASSLGLVTSIVSNGSRIDGPWLAAHGPHLRWITLSIDSVRPADVVALGRRLRRPGHAHLDQVRAVCAQVHAFNASRPSARRLRLKLNVTVTATNVDEDPSDFIAACRPEKVKLLQMLLVEGENDAARDLVCDADGFAAYVARARRLEAAGIEIVCEDTEAMDGSYAMIDPTGRFYQRIDGRYQRSAPIVEAGVMAAWAEVGGFDRDRFVGRGGDYEPGAIADGNLPYLIAIEGLDGAGTSTVARAVAAALGAVVVTNPSEVLEHRLAGQAVVTERPEVTARPDLQVRLRVDESERRARIAMRPSAATLELDANTPVDDVVRRILDAVSHL